MYDDYSSIIDSELELSHERVTRKLHRVRFLKVSRLFSYDNGETLKTFFFFFVENRRKVRCAGENFSRENGTLLEFRRISREVNGDGFISPLLGYVPGPFVIGSVARMAQFDAVYTNSQTTNRRHLFICRFLVVVCKIRVVTAVFFYVSIVCFAARIIYVYYYFLYSFIVSPCTPYAPLYSILYIYVYACVYTTDHRSLQCIQ